MLEYETNKAIAILVNLGAAKYVKDLDLYHGRAGDGSAWEVDPLFNNGGNKTGNHNVYSVSGLYAGDLTTAKNFAEQRVKRGRGNVAEVHKIVSSDPNAIIFDLQFKEKQLSPEKLKLYYAALDTLGSFGITQGAPIKYEYKDAYPIVLKECQQVQKKHKASTISKDLIKEIFTALKKDEQIRKIFGSPKSLTDFLTDFVGAYNTKHLLKTNPRYALDLYINGNSEFIYSNSLQEYPYNSSYTSAWCANNHVVGISQLIDSATLNRTITSNSLFDTKRIMSEKQYGEWLQRVLNTYGNLTVSLINIVDNDTHEFLTKAKCNEIMEYLNQFPECKNLFDKSAGIWEGWTVGQHTESVIDFFDRFYIDELPEQLKPFMKIVFLAHDIGKGYAKENNLPQKEGNLLKSCHIYDALKIPENYRDLINYIITDSQEITSAILLNKGNKEQLKSELQTKCQEAFYSAFGKQPNEQELKGLIKICTILQSCDSGAYTRYAQIRDGEKVVSGANDNFTASFTKNERGVPRMRVFKDEGM